MQREPDIIFERQLGGLFLPRSRSAPAPSRKASANQPLELLALEDRVLYSAAPIDLPDATPSEPNNPNDLEQQLDELIAWTSLLVAPDLVEPGPNLEGMDSPPLENGGSILVVVDQGIADYQTLLEDIQSQLPQQHALLLIDSSEDGWLQLNQYLSQHQGVQQVHLFSHGASGQLLLGNQSLQLDDLFNDDSAAIWQRALQPDADIFLYGCRVAAEPTGEHFVSQFAMFTGADVAASTDRTGTSPGADWSLEFSVGLLNTDSLFQEGQQLHWEGTLAPQTLSLPGIQELLGPDRGSTSAVAVNSNGSYVVVWSEQVSGNSWDVFACQFNADGTQNGSAFLVNQRTNGDQRYAAVDMDSSGRFVITWTGIDNGNDGILARLYSANGTALTNEFDVNSFRPAAQFNSSVSMAQDGRFVIAWEGNGSEDSQGIYAQQFDANANAVGSQIFVNSSASGAQENPTVSMNSSGAFVVAWNDDTSFYYQRFDSNGNKLDQNSRPAAEVTVSSVGTARFGDILLNHDGTVVSTWQEYTGGFWDVFFRKDSADSNILINKTEVLANASSDQTAASIDGSGSGDFIITWTGQEPGDLNGGVFYQLYNSSGLATPYTFLANSNYTVNQQGQASVAATSLENYVVVWSGYSASDTANIGHNKVRNPIPVAVNDTPSLPEAGGYGNSILGNLASVNVLSNDTDPGDTLTVVGVVQGSAGITTTNVGVPLAGNFGTLTLQANGSVSYSLDQLNTSVQALRTSADTLTETFTYTLRDSGYMVSTATLTITITGQNDAPTAVADSATAIEASGIFNGTPGADPSGNVLTNDSDPDAADTKTITGVAAGSVSSASGNVDSPVTGTYGSLRISSTGDYIYTVDNSNTLVQALRLSSQTLSETFTYTMRDTDGLESTTQIVITIQGANDNPTVNLLNSPSIAENSANGTLVTSAAASEVDSGDSVTFSLSADAGGRFVINSSTGEITVANGSLLNFELATNHTITIRATDSSGAFHERNLIINLSDVDEFPLSAVTDTNGTSSNNTINEAAANGSTVGITARATDGDSLAVITYSLSNSAGGRFAINSTTGVVTKIASLDFETASTHTITVLANSSDGGSSSANFTITVTDFNEFSPTTPVDNDPAANQVLENSSAGTVVGITAFSVDNDGTNNLITYSLTDSASGRFAIDSSTGIVTLTSLSVNYEQAASHTIAIRATSSDGTFSNQTFTVNILDIPNDIGSISDTNILADTLAENAPLGSSVITAFSSHPNLLPVTYSLTNDGGGKFTIDNLTGIVSLTSGLNFEAATSHTITVRADASDGSFATQSFTITVSDIDEFDVGAVTDSNAATNNVAEHSSNGVIVGLTARATDQDGSNNTITYSLDDNASGRFAINSSTGVVTVANGTLLDFESATVHSIVVRATSTDTSFSTGTFTINVTNVNDAPTITNGATFNLAATTEDSISSGTLASSILTGVNWSDIDTGALSGLAITAVTGSGTWQFSTDGLSWTNFGTVSGSNALLISSTNQVRYSPNTQNAENASFSFRAWDRTTGTASTNGTPRYASTISTGGTTAYSTGSATAAISVTAVNDAPTISNNTIFVLNATDEDTTSSGTLASSILTGVTWADVDTSAVNGLAITGVTGNGIWQYSTNGTTWANFGSVSSTNALLLSSSTRVRYLPDNQNGETASFSFKAWDQTSGTASTNTLASYADASLAGATTAFSSNNASASLNVTAVNDAPTVSSGATHALVSTTEDLTSSGTLASAILTGIGWSDIDNDALSGLAITGTTGSGTWQYSTNGTTWANFGSVSSTNALLITSTTQVRYTPNTQNAETATFTCKAWDRTTGTASTNTSQSYASTASSGGTSAFSTANADASISVTALNDAPTITNGATYSFSSVDENTVSGQVLASTILSGANWADVDSGAINGMAITGVVGSGTWQYSTDGTTWADFGTVNGTNSLLLSSTSRFRYIPDTQNGETASFTYKGWDQTSGTASTNSIPSYASTTTPGNTSAFSINNASAQIVISSLNDAPTISNSATYTLPSTPENSTSSGTLASSILSGVNWSDVDTGALSGLAITSVTGSGTWQYSTNGSTWANFGTVSSTSALLISSTTQVRYIPNTENAETATFTFKAWDQTTGTPSTNSTQNRASTASAGGTTAFSTSNATASINVTAVNDAPTITNSASFSLAGTNEDTTSSGTLASAILSGVNLADLDSGALSGLAITGTTGSGTWQYSTDGSSWAGFGTVSATNSLLLNSSTQVRYLPGGQNAETATFTFKAWDQTSGTNSTNATPSYATTASSGGTTAFSTSNATASIVITAVNDAPTITNNATHTLSSTTEDSASSGTLASAILNGVNWTDVDTSAASGLAITGVTGSGNWQYSTNGTSWTNFGAVSSTNALLISSTTQVRYTPTSQNAETATFSFKAWDQTSGTASTNATPRYVTTANSGGTTAFSSSSATALLNVTAVNDAPTITNNATYTLISTTEDSISSGTAAASILGGVAWADVDSGAASGLAITSVTGSGTWQYSTDGSTWANFGAVSSVNALLITSTTQVRYAPNTQNAELATFSFKAWDQTSGTASTNTTQSYATTASSGGTTAFSTENATASISVTAVNDAPTAVSDSATATESGGVNNATSGSNPSGNVLTNDTDPDSGDSKSVSGVAAGVQSSTAGNVGSVVLGNYGSFTIAANGAYTYTLDNNKAAVQALRTSADTLLDTFTYTVTDGAGLSGTTQITITIQGANDAPHDLATTGLNLAENSANGTVAGTITRSDVDAGDGASYSLIDSAGGRFAINSSTGGITVANSSLLDREMAASHNITVRVTDTAGATYDETMTVSVTDVDEFDVGAVSDVNTAANSIAENTANGSLVGITSSASDPDATNNLITYSLDDSAGGRFVINSSTGVVTVANSALLNYEAATSHNITIRATSADGSASTQTFTINLTDIDEFDVGPISDSNTAANSVSENATNGASVGITATASDADGTTNSITYSLDDSADGRFTINSSTGAVTVADGSRLNYESTANHNITIRATSADGSSTTQTFTINLNNQNESPTAINETFVAVEAGGVANTTLGSNPTGNVLANDTDPDSGDTKSVIGVAVGMPSSALGQVGSIVVGQYGTLILNANGSFNFTLDNSNPAVQALRTAGDALVDTFTYTMQDGGGLQSTARLSILITGVNDHPTDQWSEAGLAINQGSSNNQYVQLQDFDDLIAGRSQFTLRISISTTQSRFFLLSYASANSHNEFRIFAFDGSLQLSFKGIDWDTGVSSNLISDGERHELTVVRDSSLAQLKLFIDGNLVAANSLISQGSNLQANGIAILAEEQDTVGGSFSINQYFRGTLWDLSVYDTAWSNSRVSSESGLVSSNSSDLRGHWDFNEIVSNSVVDQVANRSGTLHSINGSGWVSGTPTIARTDWVKPINEHLANGSTLAILKAAELDSGDAITWSLSDDAGGRFTINSSTGEITVADSSLVDRETAASFQITAVGTDLAGGTRTRTYTIQLNDIDEFDVSSIIDSNGISNQINENSANGTLVGLTAQAIDADATNNSITYALIDDAGGRFAINSSTGAVRVANGSLLNRENGASHTITVRASSADGSASTQSFTINVNDVDEFDIGPISDLNPAANSIDENAATGTAVGIAANASDADATNSNVTYSLDSSAGGRFAIDPVTGIVTVADSTLLDREAALSHTITVRATSADGSSTTQSYLINLMDVDEFDVSQPTDVDSTANQVNEGVANGTAVGISATANDSDATNNGVTWSLDDDAGGRFGINATTGVVTVVNGGLIDREAATSHSIIIRATSADGSSAVSTFVIQVGNVNESPIANADTSVAVEAGGLSNATPGLNPTGNVLLNDSDIDFGDTRAVVGAGAGLQSTTNGSVGIPITGLYGSLVLNADGDYTYTVDNSNPLVEALRGTSDQLVDTFSYTIRDASGLESTARLDVSVQGANDTPYAMWSETGLQLNSGNSNNQYLQFENFGQLLSGDEFTLRLSFTTIQSSPFFLSYATESRDNEFVIRVESQKITVYLNGLAWRTGIHRSQITDGERHEIGIVRTASDGGLKLFVDGALRDSTIGFKSGVRIGDSGTLVMGQEQDSVGGTFDNHQIFKGTYWDLSVHSTAWSNGRVHLNSGQTFHDLPDLRGHWDFELSGGDTVFDQIGTRHGGLLSVPAGGPWVAGTASQVQADWKPNLLENAATGTLVANARAAEVDQGGQIIWSLTDDAAGRFAIDASTGRITVADSSGLNFEHLQTHQIIVRATDDGGLFREETYQIRLTDVQESDVSVPIDDNSAPDFVLENSSTGTLVGLTAWAIDQDGTTNQVLYSLDDNAGGRFAINSSTGVVTVADGSLLNREAAASHNITVRATSEDGTVATRQFTINIGDVSEFQISPISDSNSGENLLRESATSGAVIGITAQASDVDATNNSVRYSLDDNAGGRFSIDENTGVVSVAGDNLFDYETVSTLTIVVRASSSDGSSVTQTFVIGLVDVDEFDAGLVSDFDTLDNLVYENSEIGTYTGLTAFAQDSDATNNIISYRLLDDDGGRFSIDSSTGRVFTNAMLDFENEGPLRRIEVLALSEDGSTSTCSFLIEIADVYRESFETYAGLNVEFSPTEILASNRDNNYQITNLTLENAPAFGELIIVGSAGRRVVSSRELSSLVISSNEKLVFASPSTTQGSVTLGYTASNVDGRERTGLVTIMVEAAAPPAPPPPAIQFTASESSSNSSSGNSTERAASGSDSPSERSTVVQQEAVTSSTIGGDASSGAAAGTVMAVGPLSGNGGNGGAGFEFAAETESGERLSDKTSTKSASDSNRQFDAGSTVSGLLSGVATLIQTAGTDSYVASDQSGLGTRVFATAAAIEQKLTNSTQFTEYLSKLETALSQTPAVVRFEMPAYASAGASLFTVGYVAWLIRGGVLLTSFMSSLPSWQSFDPLPILENAGSDGGNADGSDASIAELVDSEQPVPSMTGTAG